MIKQKICGVWEQETRQRIRDKQELKYFVEKLNAQNEKGVNCLNDSWLYHRMRSGILQVNICAHMNLIGILRRLGCVE